MKATFRERYLSFEELSAQLDAWAKAHPAIVCIETIGTSGEGRPLRVLVIGRQPERRRPAVWVDANIHAGEVCGSSVALAIAEDIIGLHTDPEAEHHAVHALPSHLKEILRDVLFYIHPRMSPDGAEKMLDEAGYTRSTPRYTTAARNKPRWIACDIDGDGRALTMRVRDPAGDYVEDAAAPGLMRPRALLDPPPYYCLYPEGRIEHREGYAIPDPSYLGDNDVDLNRNFPYSWQPEPEQAGAGAFGTSEPESRAVAEFATRHPEIFAWLNLHTFGGVFIRPLGHASDKKMAPEDLALYRQIEAWGDEITGYPTVSGYDEFLYSPDKPLHGDLVDYAFHVRGAIAYVCELWDLFRELGLPRLKPFVDHYSRLTADDLRTLYAWDREKNERRIFQPWKRAVHPQLGDVEVGGLQPLVGIQNPPYERLAEICEKQSAMFLRVAALAPHVECEAKVEPLGADLVRIVVDVRNTGYLPTYVLASAKELRHSEPLRATLALGEGLALASPDDETTVDLGHLEGWGHGLYGDSLFSVTSRKCRRSARASWVVRANGACVACVVVGACRVGETALRVTVPS